MQVCVALSGQNALVPLKLGALPKLSCHGLLGRIAVLERHTHGSARPESAISMSRTSFHAETSFHDCLGNARLKGRFSGRFQ